MVSVSDVVTLLDTALGCFERVQIARSFDDDLDNHRIKLDIIQLRLSRWGEAVGLCSSSDSGSSSTALTTSAGGGEGTTNKQSTTPLLAPEELETAQDLLEAISSQFTRAEKKAASMQPQLQQDSIDPENDLSSPTRKLRTGLRAALSRRWAKLVDATHSVQWAFYKKQQFDEFVTNLSANISDLEALFPTKEEAEKRLCDLGASDCVGINKVHLRMLRDVTKEEGCDPYLNAAVVEALKPQNATKSGTTINMSNEGHNYGQQIGQMSGTQKGFSFGTTNNFGKGATNNWGVGAN